MAMLCTVGIFFAVCVGPLGASRGMSCYFWDSPVYVEPKYCDYTCCESDCCPYPSSNKLEDWKVALIALSVVIFVTLVVIFICWRIHKTCKPTIRAVNHPQPQHVYNTGQQQNPYGPTQGFSYSSGPSGYTQDYGFTSNPAYPPGQTYNPSPFTTAASSAK